MRWTPGGRSENLEDRRGGGGFSIGRGGLGVGGGLVALLLSLFFGEDFLSMFRVIEGGGQPQVSSEPIQDSREEPMVQFVSFVLDDTQRTWQRMLGGRYRDAKLVLFREATQSGCGFAGAATGPFYCPADEKVYIDLSFYEELKRRFGAPGDFAQSYVLAHEIGHHVQHLLGIDQKVRQAQQADPSRANALSVRTELQADCFAGVWGNSTARRDILEKGDVEEGLNAAAAIGDDRLTRGRVSPDSFTHGTSAQRVGWFRRGLESGQVSACDTFASSTP
jgi:uncharacterized protein